MRYVIARMHGDREVYYTWLHNWRYDLEQAIVYGMMEIDSRVEAHNKYNEPKGLPKVYKRAVRLALV